MIAFIREPEKPREMPTVRRLRRFLASSLLTADPTAAGGLTSTPAWRVGLYLLWVMGVALWSIVYFVQNLWFS
jgi:hypothetical protein